MAKYEQPYESHNSCGHNKYPKPSYPHKPKREDFCDGLEEVLESIAKVEKEIGEAVEKLAGSLEKACDAEGVVHILKNFPDAINALVLLEQATIRKLNAVCKCENCERHHHDDGPR